MEIVSLQKNTAWKKNTDMNTGEGHYRIIAKSVNHL